jgi:hypothetical protein
MAVDVDEARRDDRASGIDLIDGAGVSKVAECGDPIAADANIDSARRAAGAIVD